MHDLFPTDLDASGKRHLELQLPNPPETQPEEYALLALLVNTTHVSFYKNLDYLGSVSMPRPLTDCFNNFEGILLGGPGIEMGQLRFYPRALTKSDIEEIYQFGSRLSDMSTGSQPFKASEDPLSGLGRSLKGALDQVQSAVANRQELLELTATAQLVEESKNARLWNASFDYATTPFPVGETNALSWNGGDNVETVDSQTSRNYYKLLENAAWLTKTTNDDQRFISNMPSFLGTGATLTWWYRHIPCPGVTCGVYLFHSGDFSGVGGAKQWCWTVWIEDEALWFDAGGGGYTYFESDMKVSHKFKPSGDKFWRHMAFQMDEGSDTIRFFLDGVIVLEKNWDVVGYGKAF